MPEGPEVARSAQLLLERLNGATIQMVYINDDRKIDPLPANVVITSIWSYGKKIGFSLDNGQTMIASLGMTGFFSFTQRKETTKVAWMTDRGPFFFGDPRHFGGIEVVTDVNYYLFVKKKIGPDLLRAAMTEWLPFEQFHAIFTKKRSTVTVAEALLNQSYVAGIGNYLKSEILYYAAVHPWRPLNQVTVEQWRAIHKSAHETIKRAYEYNGLTIATHINPDGSTGKFPCAVYHKTHDPMGRPVTATGETRNSFFVAGVQV